MKIPMLTSAFWSAVMTLCVIVLIFLLSSCAGISKEKMLDGFDKPRSLDNVKIEVVLKNNFFETTALCAGEAFRRGQIMNGIGLSFGAAGCTIVRKKDKSCRVIAVRWPAFVLEHELEHCRGKKHQ